ncbi:MAG: hypothetical protein R2764_06335 [Bacteroidales bacterium]
MDQEEIQAYWIGPPIRRCPDPAEVASPGSGNYTIRVDLTNMIYTFIAK